MFKVKKGDQMEMEGEIKRLIKVWLSIVASLCYCYFIASKIPKGKLRLFSILPVVYLYTILPLYLSLICTIFTVTASTTWLTSFKLLLFAFDQGPLSGDTQKSLVHFIFIACLPVTVKQNEKFPSPKPPKIPLNWPIKVFFYAILLGVHEYRDQMHPKIVIMLYGSLCYLVLDIVLGLFNAVVHVVLGIEIEIPSDEPYLSTSLQDFWGRRWNLSVTNLLRHSVYKPIRSSLDNVLGATCAALLGVLGSFVISGLMHEMLIYYVTLETPTWEMTCYFILHGVCVVAEFVVKRLLKDRLQLPLMVSRVLTVGFVMLTSSWLFFPPMMRHGTLVKHSEECKVLVDLVMKMPRLAMDVLT